MRLLDPRAGAEAPALRRPNGEPLLLVAAMAAALVAILYLGRATTFSLDELVWVMDSPRFSLRDALEPSGGHLVLTSRLVYAALLELVGTDYLAYRLLAAASVLLTAGLFYLYARPRVGPLVALAPVPILLLFGSDALHVLVGNAFTVLFALSCGLGALIALRRGDRLGDLIACALLCAGVVTYSVALAFVLAVAVLVLWDEARWRRIWIPLVPALVYAGWWLWSLGLESSSESLVTASNLLLLPSWAAQSLEAVVGSLTGLDYDFTDSGARSGGIAAALALALLVAVAWRLWRGPRSAWLWGGIALFLGLATMNVLVATPFRGPEADRYMFPGAIALLVLGVEAVRGARWSRPSLAVLFALALIGTAGNLALLRDYSRDARLAYTPSVRAALSGLELAGENADPAFGPASVDQQDALGLTWAAEVFDVPPTQAYLEAVDAYGRIGYSAEELPGEDEAVRTRADRFLAGALGLGLEPGTRAPGGCRALGGDGAATALQVPAGRSVSLRSDGPASVSVGRFAPAPAVELGALTAGEDARIDFPPDEIAVPWQLSVSGPGAKVCGA